MKKSQMIVLSVLCAGIAICLVATPVHAVIIAADAFNGPQSTLAGRTGGQSLDANNGWDGAWLNSPDYPLTNGIAPANMEVTGAGTMGNNTPAGSQIPGVFQGTVRQVKENQATNTYYFGFDVQFYQNTSSLAVASIWGAGFDVPGGGGPDAYGAMIVQDFSNNGGTQTIFHGNNKSGGQTAPGVFAGGQSHRVVGRLTFQGGDGGNGGANDELLLWVNPTSEGDAPGINHVSEDLAADLNGLYFSIHGRDVYGTPGWESDNVVIATTSIGLLLAIILAGLAAGWLAVRVALRVPLLPALRGD